MESSTEPLNTTLDSLPDVDDYEDPLFMIPIYIVIMLLILVGNGVFMYIIMLTKETLTVIYIFFMSLAIADFLVGVFVIPAILYGLAEDVHTGFLQCTLLPFSQLLSVSASIGSLLFICIDRYRIVVLNLLQWTKTRALCIVAGIWVMSAVYSTRHFIQEAMKRSHLEGNEVEVCGMFIEDDEDDLWFRVADFLVLFCVPLVAMAIMYGRVIHRLWDSSMATQVSMAHKKRVVAMCLAIVVCFFVCWLPWHLTDIIADAMEMLEENEDGEEEEEEAVSVQVAIFTTALPLINSFTSPIIYASFSLVIREKMLDVIMCRKFRTKTLDDQKMDESQSVAVTTVQLSELPAPQNGI